MPVDDLSHVRVEHRRGVAITDHQGGVPIRQVAGSAPRLVDESELFLAGLPLCFCRVPFICAVVAEHVPVFVVGHLLSVCKQVHQHLI